MVKESLKKSVFISSIFCAILIYSRLIIIPQKNKFNSLFQENKISSIQGIITSSPVRTQNQKYYKTTINVFNVKNDLMESQANGLIEIYIPSANVEAFFPGKLYTSVQNQLEHVYESGGIYTFEGKLIKGCFYVTRCVSSYWPCSIPGKISFYRAMCRLQFKRLMYSWKNAGGLLLSLLSGAREYLEQDIATSFRKAGLSHILALSGMHLSIFSGIAFIINKKIKSKRIFYIFKICSIILFVWFAGFSPSLLRAFIFSLLIIIASLSDCENIDILILFCLSFLIQVIISPNDVYNIGFILSYGALSGILLTSDFFKSKFNKFLPYYFSSSLGASCGAQMITMPISLFIFKSVCPIGIIATCFISPLITIFIYTGLILIVISLIFPFLSSTSGFFMNILYTIIKNGVKLFSLAPVWSI